MERRLVVSSTGVSSITALTFQSMRREIVTGHEDGVLKCWELDSGRLVVTLRQHKGWVTDLLYWSEGKVLFSSSIDESIIQWSSAGIAFNVIEVGGPVFSLLWSPRREQLLCGRSDGISILNISGKLASNGLPLLNKKEIHVPGHGDIVRCLSCIGNKVFSAGYDKKLIIYEVSSLPGEKGNPLKCIHMNPAAHDAGITCLIVAKDADSSTWIATGSFDKKVKVWTADGKLIHSIQCSGAVSGVCYVPQTRVLWISAGTPIPSFYEPKSGENISDSVPVLGGNVPTTRSSILQLLKYFPEISEVIGTTNRKEVLSWRYNPSCCVCVQEATPPTSHIETLTYTNKVPILVFTGSYSGDITKLERLQLNPFMYSQEPLPYREQLWTHLNSEEGERNMMEILQGHSGGERSRPSSEQGRGKGEVMSEEAKERARKKLMKETYCMDDLTAHLVFPVASHTNYTSSVPHPQASSLPFLTEPKFRGFLKSLFVESLDFLVASSLDGKIFVWAYDKKTVAVLTRMQQQSENHMMNHAMATHNQDSLSNGYTPEPHDSPETPSSQTPLSKSMIRKSLASILLARPPVRREEGLVNIGSSVISRVAGFTCLHILNGHSASVTSLAVVERNEAAGIHSTCLISAGWDMTICVWDLEKGRLLAQQKAQSSVVPSDADSDEIITDLSYSKERNVFAYSTSGNLVYLRRFSQRQAEMELVGTLTGHRGEVTQVSWNSFTSKWVTGSEDETIRIWAADGGACEEMVSTGNPVSYLCIDNTTGFVIAAVQHVIKVYNSNLEILRTSHGHTDSIRAIIHIPELDQYISAGWDHTLRIWNACRPKGNKTADDGF